MLLQLDFASDIPIYLQIRNQFVMGIAGKELKPGERLPTIRALAIESGVNMMTVNKAYQQLKQEGYIQIDRRMGACVSPDLNECGQLSPQTLDALRLIISEAKLSGVPKESFYAICEDLYNMGVQS